MAGPCCLNVFLQSDSRSTTHDYLHSQARRIAFPILSFILNFCSKIFFKLERVLDFASVLSSSLLSVYLSLYLSLTFSLSLFLYKTIYLSIYLSIYLIILSSKIYRLSIELKLPSSDDTFEESSTLTSSAARDRNRFQIFSKIESTGLAQNRFGFLLYLKCFIQRLPFPAPICIRFPLRPAQDFCSIIKSTNI